MTDYNILKDELTIDPLNIGYSGMTDAEARTSLNAPTRVQITETYANAKTILAYLGASAGATFLDGLSDVAANNSAVKWVMSFIISDSGVDIGNTETRSMLNQLAAANILDPVSVDAVKALAEKQISRAEELGLGKVTDGDVEFARSL